MFKSIFSKMFTINILIILFIFIVIGAALFPLLGDYATKQQKQLFLGYADRINDFSYLAIGGDMTVFNFLIASVSDNTASDVIITDRMGKVVTAAYADKNKTGRAQLPQEAYSDVVNGETVYKIDDFYGEYNYTVLSAGMPLEYNHNVIGTIFFIAPLPLIYKMRGEILLLLFWIVIFAFIIEFFLIFLTTRKFSNNIKDISNVAVKLANGEFYNRVQVKGHDEIAELAVSFNQMAESLEKLEDLRRSFIANASHELRTPVTTIAGFVEGILDDTIPPEKQKDYLKVVLSESKRLGRLTTSLLDVAKLSSSEVTPEYTEFDINELIRLTLINLEVPITDKFIDVDIYFEDDPILAIADKDAIQRVITNLLENAIKFSPQRGKIFINVKSIKQKVQISIENTGDGIPEKELPHIFDQFYKGDKSRGMDKKGVGLGLYLVKNIINLHGERIWAESEYGKFARFNFTLSKK